MADASDFRRDFQKLAALAAPALAGVSRVEADDVSVLLAVPAARLLLNNDPALYPALAQGLKILSRHGQRARAGETITFADQAGDRRAVYVPLVVHLHLAAFALRYEELPASLWSVGEDALPDVVELVRGAEDYADTPPPPERVAIVLWQALCLAQYALVTARDVDLELVDGVVHAAVAQHPDQNGDQEGVGPHPIRPQSPDESIEAWTYRELTGLHALANLALLRRNRDWTRQVERVARYHLENTQPDHATTQPWGVFAFLWSRETRPFAEQQVHDLNAQGGGGITPVAAMLLADAAHALGRFG